MAVIAKSIDDRSTMLSGNGKTYQQPRKISLASAPKEHTALAPWTRHTLTHNKVGIHSMERSRLQLPSEPAGFFLPILA
jgi:hypothetical protein